MAYDGRESHGQPIHLRCAVLVERDGVAGYRGDGEARGKFVPDGGIVECAALGVANQRFGIPIRFYNSSDQFEGNVRLRLSPTERTEQVVVHDDLIEIRGG